MFSKERFRIKIEEVRNEKNVSENLEESSVERKIKEKAECLKKIDFSENVNNSSENEELRQKINFFENAIKECSEDEEKEALEVVRKKLIYELSSKRNPSIAKAASIAQEILVICEAYNTFDSLQVEKNLKELKDMVAYLSSREKDFESKISILPSLIEHYKSNGMVDKERESKKALDDAREWMTLIEEAKNLLSPQETQKKEEVEISDEELLSNFKEVLKKTENNLIVSSFDKALWRKCFKDSVLSEMKEEDVYNLATLLCREWAIKFKLSSNLFKAVREFLADDEKVCVLLSESEAIKTNLIGREPISFRKNDEYCSVLSSYLDVLIADDKEGIEEFKKSEFIFNDEQKLENLYTK